jgi:hypothetical protein
VTPSPAPHPRRRPPSGARPHATIAHPQALIPQRLLIAGGPFLDSHLSAERVSTAIARGVQGAGRPEPDVCPLDPPATGAGVEELLGALDFDVRMRACRALVVAWERLEESTLRGSVAFEIATRARQGGVPAYAIAADSTLTAFDARLLDLQLILRARSPRALAGAGRRLARIA